MSFLTQSGQYPCQDQVAQLPPTEELQCPTPPKRPPSTCRRARSSRSSARSCSRCSCSPSTRRSSATALPRIITDLNGQRALHVVGHDLPADLDDQRPDLRQAVRPVRPAPDRHLRGQPVPRSARRCAGSARRCGSSSCSAASRASAAAPSSRSRSRSSPTSTRRPSAASTSACSAPCSACRRSSGPGLGGFITDTVRLALDLLHQHPDRADLAVHPVAAPAGDPAARRPARTSTTSARRCSPLAIAPFLIGLTNKQTRPVDRPGRRRPDRRSASSSAPLFLCVESRAPEPIVPARPVPDPDVHDLGRGDVPRRRSGSSPRHLPAALVPDRRRRRARRSRATTSCRCSPG